MTVLYLTPKAKATKAKLNKWDYLKLKAPAEQRKPSKNEKATYRTEKIFAKHLSDKGLISITCKELMQLNIKIQTTQLNGQRI